VISSLGNERGLRTVALAMLRSMLVVLVCACGRDAAPAPPSASPDTATAAYDRKDWKRCAAEFERAHDWYNAACCHALADERDPAFAMLARLADIDGDGLAHMKLDADLASLHNEPRWTALVDSLSRKIAAHDATINRELAEIFRADQADRQKPTEESDWAQIAPRDHARAKRVDEILGTGGAKVAEDYYHAAMVFQHGDDVGAIEHAHELAMRAVKLDPTSKKARWLAAASEDRILVREDKLQKWGTQYSFRGGRWVLEPVDPTVTDDQRADWNVPPLAEARARAAQMNAAAKR
jgi:hypothetical protein